jgi:XRE family aerobic/anaerobic benzoate catabolism transcriptional regulator
LEPDEAEDVGNILPSSLWAAQNNTLMLDRQRLLEELGRSLRSAREQAGLTVSELGRRARVSRRTVTEVEAGRANLSIVKLAELASALGVPLADLCRIKSIRSSERVALVGVRGAGKSTIGPRLALALEAPFVELDRRVEEVAGIDLHDVFALHGEAGFHRFEAEALERVLAEGERVVLAAGGSIVSHAANFRRLLGSCRTVWLRAEADDHFQRVLDQGDGRPMRDRPRARAELEALLAARDPLYKQCEIEVSTSGRSIADTVAELLARLSRRE